MDPVNVNSNLEIDTEQQAALPVPPEVMATMVEIGEEINASLNLDDVLARAASLTKRLIDYEIFAVLLLDEKASELYFHFAIGHRREVVDTWRIPLGQGITGRAAATQKPVRVGDVSKDRNYLNAVDTVRSELAVPLLYKGKAVGVLDIQSNHLNYFTSDQQTILTLLASRLAGAIENARLFESTRRQAEMLALLNEVGREASSILDVEELLRRAAELVKKIIDYQILSLLLFDEKTNSLSRYIDIKYGQWVQGKLNCKATEGIIGAAANLRKPVIVPDVSRDSRYISVNPETRSELAIPLLYKNRVIGVLDLESPHLNYFTEEHVQALSTLAAQLAVALENARLFESTRRQAETLALLNEVGREASSILDVEELLRRAAELVKKIIDYQILSLLLFDEKTNTLSRYIDIKYGQWVQGKLNCKVTEGIIGAAAHLRKPVVVPDVSKDSRYISVNPETRSELAVPLLYKNRVIGVLDLESPHLNYFTEEHVQALSTLAAQLAVALENARLYEQVTRDEARMERELRAARRIQAAMLPAVPAEDFGLDIARRYVSARELGGDLYDFLPYGPQQLAIALGDVSGKGTAAALYGAVASGILRSLAPLKLQPAEMLRRLNQFVCEQKVEDRFVTLCFATWQKGRRKLRIANAGQSQPLLWKAGRCEKLKIEGFPIGIFDEVSYDEWGTTLDSGNILVLYSDGLTEAVNAAGEQFGAERLRDLVAAHSNLTAGELADQLMREVNRYTLGAPLSDDRTLLVLKVR